MIKDFHKDEQSKLEHVEWILREFPEYCEECKKRITLDNCWAQSAMCYMGTDKYWCSEQCTYKYPRIVAKLFSPNKSEREYAERICKYFNHK